jgi:hypothetical protein
VAVQEREPVDVLAGMLSVVAGAVRAVGSPVVAGARSGLARSARLARAGVPDRLVTGLADRGAQVRGELERQVPAVLSRTVRQTVEAVLGMMSLTELVLRHVDLDALTRQIDVGAVVERVDLDAVAARLDLDAVISRVDVNAVAARLDLEPVLSRVDVDAVASRVDLAALVARVDPDDVAKRIDVDAVVGRADLDAIIVRLDLPRIVNEVIVAIDLPRIVEEVIAAIDLPEILRESSGSAASEVVRGIRAESVQADDAVARVVDRLLHRKRPRPVEQP